MKILVFGTGTAYQRFMDSAVLGEDEIVALIDNDLMKQGKTIDDHQIISPAEISNLHYDYILITSQFLPEIHQQLIDMGIHENHILSRGQYMFHKKNFSIVADDCWGGSIYKDLGVKYNSPFTWTAVNRPHFFKFMRDPNHYLRYQLRFIPSSNTYPVAMLDDIIICFVHCKDEQDAKDKWFKRLARFDWNQLDNIYFKSTITDYNLAEEFDKIPVKHKIAFTDLDYGFESCIWIKNWEHDKGEKYKETEFWQCVFDNYHHYFDVLKWLDNQPDYRK